MRYQFTYFNLIFNNESLNSASNKTIFIIKNSSYMFSVTADHDQAFIEYLKESKMKYT
jgi:hypothetical protein